jgi:hypothetical protein
MAEGNFIMMEGPSKSGKHDVVESTISNFLEGENH